MTGRRTQAGFTLVEVLLAVLIAGLVMVGSYSVSSQVMRLSEEAGVRLRLENATAVIRLALTDDLGSVIYVERSGKVASEAMFFIGGGSATSLSGQTEKPLLALATAATLDPGQPFPCHGLSRVSYVLRPAQGDGQAAQGLSLVRRERIAATVPDRDTTAGKRENETVLVAHAEDVAVQFYAGAGAAPTATWDSRTREDAHQSPLPAQVRLTGTIVLSGRRFPLDIRVTLPARSITVGGQS